MGQSNSTPARNSRRSRSLSQGTSQPSTSRVTTIPHSHAPPQHHSNLNDHSHTHAQAPTQRTHVIHSQSLPSSYSHSHSHTNFSTHEHSTTRGQNHMSQPHTTSPQHQAQQQQQQHLLRQQQQPQRQQQQQQQQTQTSIASATGPIPARVIRSTTRRRRLLAAFYPLLSRNSNNNNSDSLNNTGSNNITGNSNGSVRPTYDNNNNSNNRPPVPETRTAASLSHHHHSERPLNRPTSTRSQTIQNTSSNTRTPRGVSRVQRRYDEQSIRSFRSSSSRSSSLFAIPSSSTATTTHPHVRHHQLQYHGHPSSSGPMELDHDTAPVHSAATIETLQRPNSSSDFYASQEMQSDHIAATVPGAAHSTDMIHGIRTDGRLYVSRSNPRGGTSISSSLLPIRPDSEDEDDGIDVTTEVPGYNTLSDQELDVDHAQRIVTESHNSRQFETHNREGAGERRLHLLRPNRYPPPEIVADLIQEQITQGIAEAAASRASLTDNLRETLPLPSPLPLPSSSSTSIETVRSGIGHGFGEGMTSTNTNTEGTLEDGPFTRRNTRIHRRRLRSSSLRGLLGFQLLNNVAAGERIADSDRRTEQRSEHIGPQEGQDQRRYADSQLSFFTRLVVDVGRSLRGNQAQSVEEGRTAPIPNRLSPAMELVAEDGLVPSLEDTLISHSTDNTIPTLGVENESSNSTPLSTISPTTEANIPSRPRRHTTIRFIQIGGNGNITAFGARRPRSTSVTPGQGSPHGEQSENPTGAARDELADAILMFLGNPGSESMLDTESSEAATTDGSETARSRPRRSPWVVFTLSGAYLSSLLAGVGEEGEEVGMSYDELWMLSNLIGPARPITTTQEAIDNAGFHIGQFENASQGMRDYDVLGDGSKCLVCMSDYEEGEDIRALGCKHGFHQECIDKWLTTGANKCPVCRATAVIPTSVE